MSDCKLNLALVILSKKNSVSMLCLKDPENNIGLHSGTGAHPRGYCWAVAPPDPLKPKFKKHKFYRCYDIKSSM
jgi:hypothetical protein